MNVWTKRGVDIVAPTDAAGNPRKVVNGEMQTWMTEVERLFNTGAFNSVDAVGLYADRSTFDGEAEGFVYVSIDGDGAGSSSAVVFIKESAASGDWSPPVPFQGDKGWSPLFRVVSDGARRLLEVYDWIGGDGEKPDLIGYIGAAGITANIAEAIDIRGPQGVSGTGLSWNFDDGTADADPGAGKLRADAADLSAATELFVSKTSAGGDPVASFLAGLTNSTSTHKGYLIVTDPSMASQVTFDVTGMTDAAGYVKIAVSGHSGTLAFDDAAPLSVVFSRTGNAGDLNGVNPGTAGLEVLASETKGDARDALQISGMVQVPWYGTVDKTGVASSQTAVAAAVADAYANGYDLYWPAGTYLTTATIPNLHDVRHFGPGVLKRGSNLFYVQAKSGEANTLYVDTAGDDTNDGLSFGEPLATIQTAIDAWGKYARTTAGEWTIKLAAGTYTEGAVVDGVRSATELVIDGQNKATCIIDGTGAVKTVGVNFNGGVRGRTKNLTVRDFSASLIAFQNGSEGVIDTCDGAGITNFGFNASEFSDMNIIGDCDLTLETGGRGIRYYRYSTGSLGDGTNTISIDGQGNTSDGLDIYGSTVVAEDDAVLIDSCGNNGAFIRNHGRLELRRCTISNNGVGVWCDDLSSFAEVGPITYTGNTQDKKFSGFAIREAESAHVLIGSKGPSGDSATSNYDLVVDSDGQTGLQFLANGGVVNIDANQSERISFDNANTRLRFYANNVEGMQINDNAGSGETAALLLVNDGTTTSIRRVKVGSADSGGSGQRVLTVDN